MRFLFVWMVALVGQLLGANPYLAHKDDAPVVRRFSGAEWGDDVEIPIGKEKGPFAAEVTTQRLAQFPWGSVYQITFKPSSTREISPYHFLATDDAIYVLAWDDPKAEIAKLEKLAGVPKFEKRDVWGLVKGSLKVDEDPWKMNVTVRGDVSTRQAFHENSGHFGRIAWKRGIGLTEFAMGRGAMADGFELQLQSARSKRK